MKSVYAWTAAAVGLSITSLAVADYDSPDAAPLGIEPSTATVESIGNLEIQPAEPVTTDVFVNEESVVSDSSDDGQIVMPGLTTYQLFQTPKTEYRVSESSTTIVPSSASDFGWFSLESSPFSSSKAMSPDRDSFAFTGGIGMHFLRGPTTTPIESRLFDFVGGLQTRKTINSVFSYDLATSIGAYSDFEDSARDGIRFQSHAVGFLDMGCADLVFGVEYLDREDIKLLPVGGIVLRNEDLRAELVFPRPRIDIALDEETSLFFKGNLGGGSWDIERPDESNDVFTYRAFEVTVGLQSVGDESVSSVELGYVFDRTIEFRNTNFEETFGDAFIIRFVSHQ